MPSFREIAFQFSGEAEPLIQTLRNIQRHIERVPLNKSIHIAAKTAQARAEIDALESKLEALDHAHHDVTITAEIKRLAEKLATAKVLLASLPDNKVIDIKARSKVDRDIARVNTLVADTVRGANKLGGALEREFKKAVTPAFNLAGGLSRMSLILRRIPPLLAGISVVLVAAFVPAILAGVSAIAALVTAVGGLATALVAALGPVAIVLVGVFTRLQKIMEARQTRQQALNSATRDGAQADRDAAAAAEQKHDAHRAVADALRGVQDAQRVLTQAEDAAHEGILTARKNEADAIRNVQEAQQGLRDATVQAYREMQDAILGARRAALDLQDAQLGKENARLNLEEARLDLEKFRKEAGLASDSFDGLFKKFENVRFKPKDAAKLLSGAGVTDDSTKLEGERLALRLKEATLGVAQADQAEREAKLNANRAQQDANKFKRDGIRASDGYRSAINQLADAQRAEAEAAVKLATAEQEGVAKNPQVIAAHRSLEDAQRRLTEARHDERNTLKELATRQAEVTAGMALYEEQRSKLTAGEQKFLDTIDAISNAYKSVLAPATDAIFGSLADVITEISNKAGAAKGILADLGGEMGRQVTLFGDLLLSPMNLVNFAGFGVAAKSVVAEIGDAFRGMFQTLVNVAAGVMPTLISELGKLGDFFKGTADATADPGGIKKVMEAVVPILDTVLKGAVDLGAALVAVFLAAKDPITDFVKSIQGAISGFLKFAKSAKGQKEIKGFFKDTLPFVKSLGRFIKDFFRILLIALRIVLPIAKPVFDMFSDLAEILIFLLKVVNFILSPFKTLIGVIISLFIPMGFLSKVFRGLKLIIEAFPFALGLLIRGILDFGEKAIGPFRKFWDAIKGLFSATGAGRIFGGFLDGIKGALSGVGRVILAPFKLYLRILRTVIRTVFNAIWGVVKGAISKIGNAIDAVRKFFSPVINAFRRLGSRLRTIMGGVGDFISGVFRGVLDTVKGAINIILRGINFMIRTINKIPSVNIPHIGRVGLPKLPEIPLLASGGLATSAMLAVIGDGPNDEAALPLTNAIFKRIGAGIVSAMRVSSPNLARPMTGLAGGGGITVEKVILPPAPAAAIPDARYQAVQLARELSRRGGGTA